MSIPIKLPSLKEFRKDTRLMIWAAGIVSMSFMGIHALLKVLYVRRLGFSTEFIGVYLSLGAFTYMTMSLPSGALGRIWGTRKTMWIGAILLNLGTALLPALEFFPESWWQVVAVASQFVMTAGWNLFNVNSVPALRVSTTANTRNSAFSLTNAMRETGTFIGSNLGGLLPGWFAAGLGFTLDDPAPYRWGLVIATLVGVAAMVPLLMIRSGEAPPAQAHREKHRLDKRYVLPVILTIGYIFTRHSGWASAQAFFNIYLDADLRAPVSLIGTLNSIARVGAILASLSLPALMDKRSHAWILAFVTAGIITSLLVMGLVPNLWGAGIGYLGLTLLTAMWLPTLQVFQTHVFDENSQALIYGASSMAMGMGFSVMSFGGGYFVTAYGYGKVFLLGAAVSVVSAVLLGAMLRSTAKLQGDGAGV